MNDVTGMHRPTPVAGLLGTLPVELLIRIFASLDSHSLVAVKQLCHSLNTVIQESLLLQYTQELGESGMEDGPNTFLTTSEKISQLRQYLSAWRELEWADTEPVPLGDPTSNFFDMAGGVMAQVVDDEETNKRLFKFTQLPSRLRHVDERSWLIPCPPFEPRAFAMCPLQDLLVLVELSNPLPDQAAYNVHLRTLGTGKRHPEAIATSLEPVSPENHIDPPYVRCTAKIFGQHLAIMFMSSRGGAGQHKFAVWNWKTGELEMMLNDRVMESFTFVTEKYVMLASLHHRGRPSACVDVYDIVASSRQHAEPVLTLRFPTLHRASFPLDIRITSDPSPDKSPDPHLHVPFFTSQEDRLFVITLRAMPLIAEGTELETFHTFLPLSRLLNLVTRPATHPNELDWESWGPTNTRMVQSGDAPDPWMRSVFGLRYVHPRRLTGALPALEVYDFHAFRPDDSAGDSRSRTPSPPPLCAGPCGSLVRTPQAPVMTRAMRERSKIDSWVFEAPVVTALPCRRRTAVVPRMEPVRNCKLTAAISEDNLVTLMYKDNAWKIEILTF